MTLLPRRALPVLIVTAALAAPLPARADPVTITSGFLETMPVMPLVRLLFEGEDFFLRASADGFSTDLGRACIPCTPGATLNMNGMFDSSRSGGTATVDGVHYPQIFAGGMTGTFSSDPFVISGEGNQTLSVPFVYSGVVTGYLEDPFLVGSPEPVLTKTLSGRGIATATFVYVEVEGMPFYTATFLRYDFGDTAPVPEPASMLLIGTGLAGLAGLHRRRNVRLTSSRRDPGPAPK